MLTRLVRQASCSAWGIGEEPILLPKRKRADGILGQRVADVQVAIIEISDQGIPLIQHELSASVALGTSNGQGRPLSILQSVH